MAPLVALFTACRSDPDIPFGSGDGALTPTHIEALAGDGGVALFVDRPVPGGASVTARDPDGSVRDILWDDGTVVVDPEGSAGSVYEVVFDGRTRAADVAMTLAVHATTLPSPALVLAGEPVQLSWTIAAGPWSLLQGDLVLTRTLPDSGITAHMVPDCLDTGTVESSCWSDDPVAAAQDVDAEQLADMGTVQLPWYESEADVARVERVGLWLRVEDADGDIVLAGEAVDIVSLGASLRWGDVHVHSDLSSDGCGDIDDDCRPRGTRPGEDFFANAVAAGLDFAAITDHAEYDLLDIDDQPTLVIWDETLELLDIAEQDLSPAFIPLLGYEWTSNEPSPSYGPAVDLADRAKEFQAGHKTVLFKDPYACDAYRIAPVMAQTEFVKGPSGMVYRQAADQRVAADPQQLLELLSQAQQQCGSQSFMVFYHHSANGGPQPVNWALQTNVPVEQVEMLVEIASSHGSAECRDRTQDGCEVLTNDRPGKEPVWWGAVQEALSLGYHLGFLGGGDRHDGRPGGMDQGPSSIGHWRNDLGDGTPGFSQMWGSGVITGVWVTGPYDREGLWDALTTRRTLATTGPRGHVTAVTLAADGTLLLAGDTLSPADFPIRLWAAVRPDTGYTLDLIEVIDPVDGSTMASSIEQSLEVTLDDPGGPALYVRARLHDGEGEEHRIWISPWFVDR